MFYRFRALLTKLSRWFSASLANRLTLSILLGATFMLAVVGGSSYTALSGLLERSLAADLESQVKTLVERLESSLDQVIRDIEGLSRSSFVANGLVDASGRDVYLVPFLGDFEAHLTVPATLLLVDFRGELVASRQRHPETLSLENSAHVQAALAGKGMQAALVRERGRFLVELIHPVLLAPTGTVEGALVVQIDIGRLFAGFVEVLPPKLFHQLTLEEKTSLGSHGELPGNDLFSLSGYLHLHPPLNQLPMRIDLGESRKELFAPLRQVVMLYLICGGMLLCLAFLLARFFGTIMAWPIVELSHAAALVADGGKLQMPSTHRRQDEIGLLTEAFARMVERLHRANETLEIRVRERTAELRSSELLLANIVDNIPLAVGVRALHPSDGKNPWVLWNRAAETIFGLDRESLARHDFDGNLLPVSIQTEETLPRPGNYWSVETPYHHPGDGRQLTIDSRILGLFDAAGQISHLLAISDDITDRKRSDELVLEIARGVASQTGETFFPSITAHLAATLGADFALVGEVAGSPPVVRTIAVFAQGQESDNFVYELAGTPCETVLSGGVCSYPSRVWAHFPRDMMLKEMGIEGYLGAPLHDQEGIPMGVLVVLFQRPLTEIPLAENLLSIFAARAAAELERRQAEQALEKTKVRFRAIVQNAPSGICTVSPEGHLLSANPPFCALLGREEAELCHFSLCDVVHPDDWLSLYQDYFRQSNGRLDSLRRDCRLQGKDGKTVWVDLALTGGGDFSIVMIRDITRRRQVERTLQLDKLRSEALYRLAQMEDVPKDVLHRFILSQGVRLTGSAFGHLFSLDPGGTRLVLHARSGAGGGEEGAATQPTEFPLDAVGRWREVVQECRPVIENDYSGPLPWARSVGQEGETLLRVMNVPLLDNGQLQMVFEVANKAEDYDETDLHQLTLLLDGMGRILKQKQAEELLRNSERRYRSLYQEFQALLTGIPDRITLLDPHLRVVWSNHLDRSDVTDSPVPEEARRPCYEICFQRAEICEDCPPNRAFRSKSMEQGEVETADGRIWDIRGIPIRGELGQVVNVIELAQDITARVRAQELSIRTAHLASLGELAAGVAHEINNPINGIINYAQILADRLQDAAGEVDLPGRIIHEGERISAIVRSLLDFARPQGEAKQLVDVAGELQEALALCVAKMTREQINVRMEIAPNLPRVMSRSGQLRQVFLNILNNSHYALNVKFPGADPDKILDIQVKLIESDQERVRITVTDFGCGIASDVIDRVMNPFVTTKPVGQGTGLGLSISHGIINDHGGTVKLESVEGQFTRVRIDLPVVIPQQ
ncbi:hypothetical protein JCM30471_02020 [Desulfuromonas carbonis]|uniref:PAS domain S-box protein n=1 Tax=Desulfuromonas sp. DDH964 TaxID=1823759 RepID=UPI00078C517E|nr:PAS domain S-box protein [Desulfuromonas sp. DDH964]AMV71736.1 response receiver histidine kinase [Desulfuromonas sp. DDH964]